jgi:4'-phosphopantetheinyl transferase EntD
LEVEPDRRPSGFEDLLPDVVVVHTQWGSAPEPLSVAEEAIVRRAVASRRREFQTGRACARRALAAFGIAAPTIGQTPDRAPIWPLGVVGSITHCADYCAAAVARSSEILSLGIDMEKVEPLTPEMAQIVCRDEEMLAFPPPPRLDLDWPLLAFSAKEAFYKCYYPTTRTYLDFHDVSIRFQIIGDNCGEFSVQLVNLDKPGEGVIRSVVGRWQRRGDFLYCAAHVPSA